MLSLDQLRDHARANPTKLFPMGSCTECLACSITGKSMRGHESFEDGEPVPPELAQFTRGLGAARHGPGAPESDESSRECPLLGVDVADALDQIIAGANPYLTGLDAWNNRKVL